MGGVLGDMSKIYLGGVEICAVHDDTAQIWPNSYYATLAPSWTYAGQYTLAAIPASGGSATPTWVFKVFRTGETTNPVYQANVSPTVVCEELFGENWLTAQHFHYTGGVWSADDRARNGLPDSSGTSAPQNAPARYSRLSASYSYTFNGVPVSASAQVQMTQNPNNVRSVSSTYSNLRVSLSKYYSSSSPAPAYSTYDARVSALMDAATLYQFYDGVTNVNGMTYTYNQADAITSERFNFSCAWCSFSDKTSSGATVTVWSRGTDYDTNKRSTTIRATFTGDTTKYADVTIYQAANTYRDTTYQYTNVTLHPSTQTLGSSGTSFYVYVLVYYRYKHQYSSLEWDANWTDDVTYAYPTITNVTSTPSVSGIQYSGYNVTVPANTGTGAREYDVTASYTDGDGRTWSGLTTSVAHEGISMVWGTPYDIAIVYDVAAASGATLNPIITFKQDWSDGTDSGTISGTLSNGSGSGTASDGSSFSIVVTGTGANGGSINTNGVVSPPDRGTTPGDAWTVANVSKVKVSCNGKDGEKTYSSGQKAVTQENNNPTYVPEVVNSVAITLSTYSINTAASTRVNVSFAKASGVSDGYDYPSLHHTGQTAFTNRSVTLTSLVVDGVTQSQVGYADVSNAHNLSSTSHSFAGTYGGKTDTKTVSQDADYKVADGNPTYSATITINTDTINGSALQGSATFIKKGYSRQYYKWNSDSTSAGYVDGEESGASVTLAIDSQTGDRWHLNNGTLTHDNMGTNETTDTCVVKAYYNGAESSGANFSCTNSKTGVLLEYGTWSTYDTSSRTETQNYAVSIDSSAYTDSNNGATCKGGNFNILSVSASHEERTVPILYQSRDNKYKYSSWYQGSSNYYTVPEYQTVDGTPSSWTNTPDTPVLTSSVNWMSASGSTVSINERTSGSTSRNGRITATNGSVSNYVTLYQRPYSNISISEESWGCDENGGTKTFTVTYTRAKFNITTSGDFTPGVSPSSGGSLTGTGTVQITVTVGSNSSSSNRECALQIAPSSDSDPGLGSLEFEVWQAGMPGVGSFAGDPNAWWNSSSMIYYRPVITNNTGIARTLTVTFVVKETTPGQLPDEGSNVVEPTNLTGTIPANSSGYITTTKTKYKVRNANNGYYAKVYMTGVGAFDSGWFELETT